MDSGFDWVKVLDAIAPLLRKVPIDSWQLKSPGSPEIEEVVGTIPIDDGLTIEVRYCNGGRVVLTLRDGGTVKTRTEFTCLRGELWKVLFPIVQEVRRKHEEREKEELMKLQHRVLQAASRS